MLGVREQYRVTGLRARVPSSSDKSSHKEASSGGQDLVLKVLGTVGTGIGILGFVTFFGGAILWIRAQEADLPANEAVAVVPKAVLLTTGAAFLVPAGLLVLLVVLLIAAVHLGFYAPARFKARKLKLRARRLRYEADEARRGVKPEEKIAVSARELATKLSATLAETRQNPEATGLLVELQKEAEEQQRVASDREKEAVKARSRSENLEADAENAQAAFDFAVTNSPVLDVAQRWIELSAAFLVLTLVPLLTFGDARDVGTLRVRS